ncbi:S9 family peptidase [Fibrella forsythiae]|uniref:DPP IV N-terminal domain-containing protein n=1 Tax=Fibrella forsythiae TaxID=2817061 RepID=A0ABS3JMT5_9BACT|nr:S9 family peptidase [Fibrella forsythiae]MBO0951303.1 DPP IV N-terminal domain-containing protein [Fibrella forsythiae]
MSRILLTSLPFMVALCANAQPRPTLTANEYEKAQRFMGSNAEQLIDHGSLRPNWLSGDRFWYRDLNAGGSEFVLVDPAKGMRSAPFDAQKLATTLSKVTGKTYEAARLPFQSFSFTPGNQAVVIQVGGKSWQYNPLTDQLTADTTNTRATTGGGGRGARESDGNEVLSPDKKRAAYIKDYNLWVRDVQSGAQTQLTTDGIKDFGYATDNAGWKSSDRAILAWSPDSKKIATFKQDQREVSDMYLVTTNVGKPMLRQWKYPLPGDKVIPMIHRVIIEVDVPKVIQLQLPPDPHRATLSDDIASSGTFDDVNWTEDGAKLAFVSTSRDHKQEKVRIADATTGAVRDVFEETVSTQYESGWGAINWRYLSKTNEFIWFSERDNWGHLYLYDGATGQLKNQITKGDWLVTRLLKVDEKKRMLYFMAVGRQAANPYFGQLCQIGFDGRQFAVLTPEPGNHQVSFSPSGTYFVDSYSAPDVPPVSVVRNLDGKLIASLEKADISRLTATGWRPPTPIRVKAQDGQTDLYGLMYTPTNLDPNRKYPVIDYIYPGPQGGSVGNWSFSAARKDNQALAELGFVVVELEGTSNPLRSKRFHDMSYGNMAENTLPDQITGIQQLAKQYPYMDLDRVGIWGHSGGGFATATAMFRFPDFFKVGIAESGNHDNRNYEDDWGERYNGLTSASDYEAQANQNYAKNLKGKLMLAHGMMDNNVPPSNTLLVVEALEKANKDYDLVLFPNSGHGFGSYTSYMTRRRWDYFVRHLLGSEPPKEFQLELKPDQRTSVMR